MCGEQTVLATLLKDIAPQDRKTRDFIEENWKKFEKLPEFRLDWTSEERAFWIGWYMADEERFDAEVSCRDKQAKDGGESWAEPEGEGWHPFSSRARKPQGYGPSSYVARPLQRLLEKEEEESRKGAPAESALEAWQRQIRSVLPESVEEVIETFRPRTNVATALRILQQFLLKEVPLAEPERGVRNNGGPNYHYLCNQICAYALSDKATALAHNLGPRKKRSLLTDKSLQKWIEKLSIVLQRKLEKEEQSSRPQDADPS